MGGELRLRRAGRLYAHSTASADRISSNLEDNVGNPFAPLLYACSTLHCTTVSLAEGGAGPGTAFGEQLARRMLGDAGFSDVAVHEAPGDPTDGVFVTSKSAK